MGINIRTELVNPLFYESELDIGYLKRAIKLVTYINRMMANGREDDFMLKQVKGGKSVSLKEKEFASIEIQVDVEELKNNVESKSSDSETEQLDSENEGDIHWQVRTLLKNHAIDIMTRMNPTKKGYYKLVWEEMSLEKLFEYKLEGVFKNREKE